MHLKNIEPSHSLSASAGRQADRQVLACFTVNVVGMQNTTLELHNICKLHYKRR